jgi:FemAB-related protein (PEP-CTERM system-associated)
MSVRAELFHGDASEWDTFVTSMPSGGGYHTHAWRAILERSFGHKSYWLAARVQGTLSGVLPLVHMKSLLFGNFLVSLPFVTYGGVLCRDTASARVLLEAAEELRARLGARHVELRHGDTELDLPAKRHKVAMMLPLDKDEQAMWSGFNAKVRNQVRKAQKAGLLVQWGGSELLDDFYQVMVRNMRDLGTPVYSRDFFGNVLNGLPQNTRLVVLRSQKNAVAAGLLYHHGTTLEIPWASSIRDFNSLCPNNLMYWESIRHGVTLGMNRFDLGRCSPGGGPFRFKEQWGAKPEGLAWHYLLPKDGTVPNLTNQNPKYSLAIDIWQRLPLAVTRVIGPPIVRCIP